MFYGELGYDVTTNPPQLDWTAGISWGRGGSKGSLRTADAFPVVASLPPKNCYFSEGENRRPEIRLLIAG